ncbi:MAG TPA: tetratricopeptide repeat protein, partial [Candidatus Caenarcaniphilales bacterium]|nr:tetratricopeptide repeat protein [Candidatus Caenarcaniphilales bacterium]
MDGRPREALAHYHDVARLAGARPLPHVCIGGVLMRTGQVREALASYDRALERAPDDASALGGKAAALLADGRPDEA